jgi:hypothetical protein
MRGPRRSTRRSRAAPASTPVTLRPAAASARRQRAGDGVFIRVFRLRALLVTGGIDWSVMGILEGP